MTQYKPFIISDPTPWLDQLIETVGVMVRRCGGTSVEYVIRNMIVGCRNQDDNFLILAACEEGNPGELVAWIFVLYVHDSKEPWAEIWGLWCKPGLLRVMNELFGDIVLDWARSKGAKKILAAATRSPEALLKMYAKTMGFKKIGLVIERRLGDALS